MSYKKGDKLILEIDVCADTLTEQILLMIDGSYGVITNIKHIKSLQVGDCVKPIKYSKYDDYDKYEILGIDDKIGWLKNMRTKIRHDGHLDDYKIN
jgi:hypothetical protein